MWSRDMLGADSNTLCEVFRVMSLNSLLVAAEDTLSSRFRLTLQEFLEHLGDQIEGPAALAAALASTSIEDGDCTSTELIEPDENNDGDAAEATEKDETDKGYRGEGGATTTTGPTPTSDP
jgi:hypothetical protein